jgi:hypothetical protein
MIVAHLTRVRPISFRPLVTPILLWHGDIEAQAGA